jgi:hypothetical protein
MPHPNRLAKVVIAFGIAAVGVCAAEIKETCNYTGSTTEGNTKVCAYSCPGGDATIRVSLMQDCPLTIVRTVR